jgi:hypothetical protein
MGELAFDLNFEIQSIYVDKDSIEYFKKRIGGRRSLMCYDWDFQF